MVLLYFNVIVGHADPPFQLNPITGGGGSVTPSGVISALPTVANAYPYDFYVSSRPDALGGSGTMFDPAYVGLLAGKPTALDTLMTTTLPALYPSGGATIHFAGGLTPTYGSPNAFSGVNHGFNLPPGNRWVGAGEWETIIQQFALPDNGQTYQFQILSTVDGANTQVEDMCFDANWPNLKSGAPSTSLFGGVDLVGTSNVWVKRCRFINDYGNFANGQEGFICKVGSPTISSVIQPCINSGVIDCLFDKFQGDYGGCILTWNRQVSPIAPLNPSSFRITGNHFYNMNHLQLAGATGGTCYCIGGGIGQGILIEGNEAINCDMFLYNDGGNSGHTLVKNNIALGILVDGIVWHPNADADLYFDVEGNHFEVSTAILGTSYNNNNKNGIALNTSSGSPYQGTRIVNNTITRKAVGYTTATRSRNGSNVATVTFSSAPGGVGFNNGDVVDTSSFGGTGYNVGYVTLTKNSTTSYSYASIGSSEGSTADTTGTLTLCVTGLNAVGSNNAPVWCQGNLVDSTLYNYFPYTAPVTWARWADNLTETGAPITLQPNTFHSLPSLVRFPATNSNTQNGTNFLAAETHAALIYPNSVATSTTNRVVVQVEPAIYDLGSGTFSDNANYVDLLGIAQRDDTVFLSSANTFLINNINDYKWKGFTIKTTSASNSVSAVQRNGSGGATEIWEDLVLTGAGTVNSCQDASKSWNGYIRRVKFSNGGFVAQAQGQWSGIAEDIEIGAGGTDNVYIASGAILRRFYCTGQFNMYRNDGVIEYGEVNVLSGSNLDAILEQNNSSPGGITRYCTLLPIGSGKMYKNSGGSRTTAIYDCAGNIDIDASITNSVTTPYNIISSGVSK